MKRLLNSEYLSIGILAMLMAFWLGAIVNQQVEYYTYHHCPNCGDKGEPGDKFGSVADWFMVVLTIAITYGTLVMSRVAVQQKELLEKSDAKAESALEQTKRSVNAQIEAQRGRLLFVTFVYDVNDAGEHYLLRTFHNAGGSFVVPRKDGHRLRVISVSVGDSIRWRRHLPPPSSYKEFSNAFISGGAVVMAPGTSSKGRVPINEDDQVTLLEKPTYIPKEIYDQIGAGDKAILIEYRIHYDTQFGPYLFTCACIVHKDILRVLPLVGFNIDRPIEEGEEPFR